jgi:serine/threonine-protein kinase
LAERLVAEKVLTEFQTSRLLRNKAHGFVVGRYIVLDRLGEGNKGRVYKAKHKLMGRLVALKVIAPQIASRASSIARFHREMRLLGRLDHPNVVRAFDADQVGDLLYIVMEYVAGRDLEQLLRDRGPLPPAEVAAYMAQAALGLGHAHDQGIVHRDVKPTNLILSEVGQVKVLDLGLGALLEADTHTSFATAAGHSVGTLHYMSPEQTTASEVDCRSDLFSLGCTMYHLLTGQNPFPGVTVVECLTRRARGAPVPITELRPDLPPRLVEVLEKLMAYRPEHRFQTATEAAVALQAVAQHGKDASPDHRPPPRPAINLSAPDPHTSLALYTGSEPPITLSCASPDPSPSIQSRPTSLLAGGPIVAAPLVLLLVGLVIFILGFALGHAFPIVLLRGGE